VYTIHHHVKTPAEIIASHKKEGTPSKKSSPRPQGKQVFETLEGKEKAFAFLEKEIVKRTVKNAKKVILLDGEANLSELAKKYLPGFEVIRDVFHVSEYLWDGAHIFHREETAEAENWFSKMFEMLLEGRVNEIIDKLKKQQKCLSKAKSTALSKVICYLNNGKEHMQYG
jgi:hypothetical protein